MLYTTALLEATSDGGGGGGAVSMRARLAADLDDWMAAGAAHLQGSFAALFLAATGQPGLPASPATAGLRATANGTLQVGRGTAQSRTPPKRAQPRCPGGSAQRHA